MKILQLNAWAGRLEHQIKDLVKEVDADIVCLQESIDLSTHGIVFANIDSIAKAGGLSHVFHSPVVSFPMINSTAYYGNTILSKKPFVKTETIFTNLEYKADFNFEDDDYNVRNLQHAVVSIGGRELNILNHHGYHVAEHKNGTETTDDQMLQIKQFASRLSGPIILTGGFNLSPNSRSLKPIHELFRDLASEANLKTTRTVLTNKTEVCDYIFINDEINPSEFVMSDKLASDHAALILEFEYK